MHQGNWTCSGCSGAITELPFEPKRTDGLTCRECYQKSKGGASSSSKPQDGERTKIAGDWKCSGCDTSITSLPFTPRDTSNLKCIDCFKKSKGS